MLETSTGGRAGPKQTKHNPTQGQSSMNVRMLFGFVDRTQIAFATEVRQS
jgi:hypothetical protein